MFLRLRGGGGGSGEGSEHRQSRSLILLKRGLFNLGYKDHAFVAGTD